MRRHRCVGGTSFNYSMDPLIVMIQSLNVHRIRVQSQVNALMRKTSQIKIENKNHRVQGNGIDYRHHRISPAKKREELCMQEWVFVKCSFFSRRRVQREKNRKNQFSYVDFFSLDRLVNLSFGLFKLAKKKCSHERMNEERKRNTGWNRERWRECGSHRMCWMK